MISPNTVNSQEFALQFVRTALSQHNQQSKHIIKIVETDIKVSVSSISHFQLYNSSIQCPFARFYDNLNISNGYPFHIKPPRHIV